MIKPEQIYHLVKDYYKQEISDETHGALGDRGNTGITDPNQLEIINLSNSIDLLKIIIHLKHIKG